MAEYPFIVRTGKSYQYDQVSRVSTFLTEISSESKGNHYVVQD